MGQTPRNSPLSSPRANPLDQPYPTVTVIICTYDRNRLTDLGEVIRSVQSQSRRPDEIIVAIDNNRALYQYLRDNAPEGVRPVLNEDGRGLSATRNTGIRIASSEVVAFIDDDAIAESDWLERLMRPLSDPTVVAVGGKEVPVWLDEKPMWFADEIVWIVGGTQPGMREKPGLVRNVHGGNMAFRREILERVGLFDKHVGHDRNLVGGEETELCLRIRAESPESRVWYAPDAVILHKVPRHRTSFRFMLRRSYAEGVGKARIHMRYRSHRGTLDVELNYLKDTLLHAFPRLILRGRIGILQAGALLASTLAVGAGYFLASFRAVSQEK